MPVLVQQGILGWGPNFEERFIRDYKALREKIDALRLALGVKVVLTSGSYDLIHEGHIEYLRAAKERGDLLVVGVDSDEKIRQRKGPDRPIVPEEERLHMLTHLRSVDLVTLKQADAPRWELIIAIQPDVLITSERTEYTGAELEELQQYCGEVVVLPSQSTTSTTSRIMQLHASGANELAECVVTAVRAKVESMRNGKGG